jgi:branched-chain amino acid transport system ATP-binding protein
MGIGRTFQIVRVFPALTLMENLVVAIEARNRSRGLAAHSLRVRPASAVTDEAYQRLGHLGLAQQCSIEARHLSLGDRKRLELALTIAIEPIILMLDEPTAGMAPSDRVAIVELIERTKEELGLTILLTEHDMDFVFRLSHTVMVLNQGERVFVGSPDEVRRNEMVQEIYLGKEMVHA